MLLAWLHNPCTLLSNCSSQMKLLFKVIQTSSKPYHCSSAWNHFNLVCPVLASCSLISTCLSQTFPFDVLRSVCTPCCSSPVLNPRMTTCDDAVQLQCYATQVQKLSVPLMDTPLASLQPCIVTHNSTNLHNLSLLECCHHQKCNKIYMDKCVCTCVLCVCVLACVHVHMHVN